MGRLTPALATAVLLAGGAAGCGERTSSTAPDGGASPPVSIVGGEVQVSCGSGPVWSPSDMPDGIEPPVPEAEIAAALDAVATDPEMSVETSRVLPEGGDTRWRVLTGDDDLLVLGLGTWTEDGAGDGPDGRGVTMTLANEGGAWVWQGHGDCRRLYPRLTDAEADWVEVTAPAGGLDRATTSVPVEVAELACTGSRDPGPHLREPVLVETEDSVTVYWTSTAPEGDQACPGNPWVPQTLTLSEPLGDRSLLDGSVWPPTPLG